MDDKEVLSEEFEKAASFLPAVAGTLGQEDLLYFYARFKQRREGPNSRPKPGFFDFEGKRKWQAWRDLADMTAEEAMRQYVGKLDEVCEDWREKEGKQGGGGGVLGRGWVTVSTMKREEEALEEANKTLLDFVKEGDEEKVRRALDGLEDGEEVNAADEEGMSALHWAADRGHPGVLRLLLAAGGRVDAADCEGQTPLHYAASCGHAEAARVLVGAGADAAAADADGATPEDLATEEEVKKLLLTKR